MEDSRSMSRVASCKTISINASGEAKVVVASSTSDTVQDISSSNENSGPDRKQWANMVEHYGDQSWMHHLPWEPKHRIDPEDYYVSLTLDNYGRAGEKNRAKAELIQLFDSFSEGGEERAKRVLVRADAGFGKSTLCMKVVYDWSSGKDTFSALPYKTFLPLLFKLRFLGNSVSLEDELFRFAHSMYSPKMISEKSTRKVLQDLRGNILIVLDGFDEVNSEVQQKVKSFINTCKTGGSSLFSFASFLVTSRQIYEPEFLSLFQKHYCLSHLSESKVKELVLKLHDGNAEETETFFRNHGLVDLIKLPLLSIFTVCWINKQGPSKNFMNNKEFNAYFDCVFTLAKYCSGRQRFNFTEEEILCILCELGRLCITRITLTDNFLLENFPTKHCSFLLQIGILKPSHRKSVESLECVYEPVHRSFIDSLASYYIYSTVEQCHSECDFIEFLQNTVEKRVYNYMTLHIFFTANDTPIIELRQSNDLLYNFNEGFWKIGISSLPIYDLRDYASVEFGIVLPSECQMKHLFSMLNLKTGVSDRFWKFYNILNSRDGISRVTFICFENSFDHRIKEIVKWVREFRVIWIAELKSVNPNMHKERFYYFVKAITGSDSAEFSDSTSYGSFLEENVPDLRKFGVFATTLVDVHSSAWKEINVLNVYFSVVTVN